VWGVAIALGDEDRLPRGPKRDFALALHSLYDQAGQPAARQVSRAIYRRPHDLVTVSHETVSSTLRGDIVPAWPRVQAMVTIFVDMSVRQQNLDAAITLMHQLWLAARRESDSDPGGSRNAERSSPQLPPAPAEPPARPSPWSPPTAPPDDSPAEEHERIEGPLPDRNPLFTGREILLDTMHAYHLEHPNAPLVVYGIGGVGKTQLAREYVHRFADEYTVVWWLPAEPVEEAGKAMVSLAERMHLPVRPSTEQTVSGVLGELESRRVKFLLVFDGAASAEIRRLIPTLGGDVLITTRDPSWAQDSTNTRLEVADFDEAEAIQFLRKGDPQMTGQRAADLIRWVGRLPLALAQLIALHQASGMTWAELSQRLDQPERRLLSTAADSARYPNTVESNLRLALEQLRRANPVAVLVFELFAWFGPEPVSMSLLRRGATAPISPELQRALSDTIVLNRVVADISRFGLGRVHTQDQRIEVHPVMRLALRDLLSADDNTRARNTVQAILTAADPGSPDEVTWDLHRAMAAHVLPSGLPSSRLPAAHRAVYHQVRYRYLLGDLEDAQRLGDTAVMAWQGADFLGPDAEFVLLTKREWANVLRALGRYARAREIDAEVMTRLRGSEKYGENHMYTLDTARGYAADLRIAGDYQRALELDRESHHRLSAHHPNEVDRIGVSHHNMAVSHRLLGDFAAAETIDRDELRRRHEYRGRDDRRTRLSHNALAEDLFGLGRFQEILDLEPDSLTTAEGAVRPGELGLLLASRTIGLAHRRLGRVGRAHDLLQAHYTECAASFGADHGFTLAATLSYANVLRERGLLGRAYQLAVDAVAGYERAFGPANPLTQAARLDLAAILRAREAMLDALRTDETALQNLRESVGDAHPFTIVARINFAVDQARSGSAAAQRTAAEAYGFARDVLGPQHFDTLSAASNLSQFTTASAAERDAVLADLRRTLGSDHPRITEVAKGHWVDCDVEPPSL
jgi:hypothetical protein